jgi:hypothetical protein
MKTHYVPDEALPPKKVEEPKIDRPDFTPKFVGTQVQTLNLSVLKRQLDDAQRIYNEGRIGQDGGSVNFNSGPICIFFVGDVHYGSVFCEHKLFHKHMNMIKRTKGCFVVFMSNMIDNAIPSQYPSNMLNNSIPPDKQVIAMRKVMEDLNRHNKILGAVTSPCHEGWTWKHTGQDINALIYGFPKRKFPVLDNGSILKVKVGRVTYNVALFHQVGPFESNFNETHALKQMNRLNLLMRGDVVVGAHRHFSAAQLVYEGNGESRKPVAYIRTGTYKGTGKTHDSWSVGRYGATGEPSGQSVILYPSRKMIVNLEFQVGIDTFKRL